MRVAASAHWHVVACAAGPFTTCAAVVLAWLFTVVPRDPEPFDWYQRYSGLKDLVGQYMKADDHILMLGCGNSRTWHRPGKPCQATPALRGM